MIARESGKRIDADLRSSTDHGADLRATMQLMIQMMAALNATIEDMNKLLAAQARLSGAQALLNQDIDLPTLGGAAPTAGIGGVLPTTGTSQ